jgi:NAD(P)-dependent dehydrogenase (short-subunit alcohol dehydrogenase family)
MRWLFFLPSRLSESPTTRRAGGLDFSAFKEIVMKMNKRLKDKAAIITGAASGIGKATAVLFAKEGAQLALADIDADGLKEVAELIAEAGGTAIIKKTDVSNEDEVKALITLALKSYPKIDILCNIAGVAEEMTDLDQQDRSVWQRIYDVNVMGAVYTTKHVCLHMQERNCGANAYSASKAALINFTQTAACDLGGYNVRVNAVCPGLIETGMTQSIFDYARKVGKESKLGSRCELRRYGKPEEVARVILFLASDEASFVTGQALPVDGGNTASLNLPGMLLPGDFWRLALGQAKVFGLRVSQHHRIMV